jgi:hypothetical protein
MYEAGAGDAVAAVNTLFNTVSPGPIVDTLFEGNERDHAELKQVAMVVFVSTLGRLVGNILVRSPKTNLTGVNIDTIRRIVSDVAREAVIVARRVVKLLPMATYEVIEKWGIRLVLWTPRQLELASAPVVIK